jgi:cytochrome oxidase Cu insertion factor (SCO1/SenC/PrrC family)
MDAAMQTAVAPANAGGRAHRVLAALVGKPAFWIVVVGALFALPLVRSLTRKLPPGPAVLGHLTPFETRYAAGDGTGTAFSSRELEGKVWVATFLDPACATCETLADGLAKVQRRARNLGDDHRLITFLPPGADAARANDFATRHHPNPWRWYFLAAAPSAETQVSDAMHRAALLAPMVSGASRVHAQHVATLVDRRGRIRGFYDVTSDEGRNALLADAGLLANLPR